MKKYFMVLMVSVCLMFSSVSYSQQPTEKDLRKEVLDFIKTELVTVNIVSVKNFKVEKGDLAIVHEGNKEIFRQNWNVSGTVTSKCTTKNKKTSKTVSDTIQIVMYKTADGWDWENVGKQPTQSCGLETGDASTGCFDVRDNSKCDSETTSVNCYFKNDKSKDYYHYHGSVKNCVPDVEGTVKYKNGDVYRGEFYNDDGEIVKAGDGVLLAKDGWHYDGRWKCGQMYGKFSIWRYTSRGQQSKDADFGPGKPCSEEEAAEMKAKEEEEKLHPKKKGFFVWEQ